MSEVESNLRKRIVCCAFVFLAMLGSCPAAHAQAKRIVVVKVDGLVPASLDEFVKTIDARTGKSSLPYINHIFYENGTRVENFYVRGMSLSAASWSLLDTGRHLQIKGNVEYDRLTLKPYDYLNIFQFYLGSVLGRHVDSPGAELLDEINLPLLIDAFPDNERYGSFQLFQRGVRWSSLGASVPNYVAGRSLKDLLDEWTFGFELRPVLQEQTEKDVINRILNRSEIRYLDFYTTEYDHATHGNRDRVSHLAAAQDIDAQIGRIWTAIRRSPLADETALILVSDHGTTSHPQIYSQGFNLVKLLNSRAGGGHHVVTKRRLLLDYALKGINPLVPLVYSTSRESFYLKNQSTVYPTAMLDFDGNERAAIHLRNNTLNVLHLLLQQLKQDKLSDARRRAATLEFLNLIATHQASWRELIVELHDELNALERQIAWRTKIVEAEVQPLTQEQREAGVNLEANRRKIERLNFIEEVARYRDYLKTLENMIELQRATFDAKRIKIEDLIHPNSMGEANELSDLQSYVVGLAPEGLQIKADGTLDMDKSFTRVNYFPLLLNQKMQNNVQAGISANPIDFVAFRLDDKVRAQLAAQDSSLTCDEAVWLYTNDIRQALILGRTDERGRLQLRYVPVKHFSQNRNGKIFLMRAEIARDFPLKIYEDANLAIEGGGRATWLDLWHTDTEWLRATHRTLYSNAVVGIHEQFARHALPQFEANENISSNDARLLYRFRTRQRRLVETDLFVHANPHWNFDVRGFNPGGNHGSFYRVSTHSVLMLAGGSKTNIPRAYTVEEPYDSLDFVPTIFALADMNHDSPALPQRWRAARAEPLPGRIIKGIFGAHQPAIAPDTAAAPDTVEAK